MVTRIVAVRHGETAWNRDTRIQGHQDIPLNDTGRWQAQRVADALADEGIEAIYSSDLLRAWQTAEALAARLALPITADDRLRERCFGVFETLTYDAIDERWPEPARRWRQREPAFAPDGGESLDGFSQRCVGAVIACAQAHPGQTIAIVAHGGVMDCLYRAATRLDLQAPRSWHLGNAGINRLLLSSEGLALVGWGDTRHLEGDLLDEFADGSPRGVA